MVTHTVPYFGFQQCAMLPFGITPRQYKKGKDEEGQIVKKPKSSIQDISVFV